MPALQLLPTEHQEQKAFIEYGQAMGGPWLRFYAIPNGGDRHPAVAGKLKAEGARPGIPDLHLPIAKGQYHGLYLEMKRQKGGILSESQSREIALLQADGYAVFVPEGMDEAVEVTKWYLNL